MPVDLHIDRSLLASSVSNITENAFEFFNLFSHIHQMTLRHVPHGKLQCKIFLIYFIVVCLGIPSDPKSGSPLDRVLYDQTYQQIRESFRDPVLRF